MANDIDLDYTPEGKKRLEIDKLRAEVADLRSWIRRWLGTLGGLVGIVTAAVSIIVTVYQVNESSREKASKIQEADSKLAEARKLDAERRLAEAVELEKKTKSRIDEGRQQLAEIKNEIENLEKGLADSQAL